MIGCVDLPVERIRALAGDERFIAAMDAFYQRLASQIDGHRPVCRNRGACCRFGEFGHRLYVTAVELAYFAGTVGRERAAPEAASACPYQIEGLCDVRESRPMGCRVFFCESAGQGWQEDLTESALGELRTIHEQFDIPYAYSEWLTALRQLSETTRPLAVARERALPMYSGIAAKRAD